SLFLLRILKHLAFALEQCALIRDKAVYLDISVQLCGGKYLQQPPGQDISFYSPGKMDISCFHISFNSSAVPYICITGDLDVADHFSVYSHSALRLDASLEYRVAAYECV